MAPGVLAERRWCRGTRLPACFEFAHTSFLSGESSGQGKAGAAWGCRPTEHPLPTPAGNPALFLLAAFRPARLLGKAGVSDPVGSPSRALLGPMRTSPQSVLRDPLIRGKSFDKPPAGKETFGPKEKGVRICAARSSPTGQAARFSALPGKALPVSHRATSPRVLPGKPRDAQGMSATGGSANSQSASEQGESAKRERALRTRLASSGGQLTKRSERDAGRAQARAALERNEALV